MVSAPARRMKIVSVNIAQPRIVEIQGEPVLTGIFKEPVSGPIWARKLGLDGDGQADHSVHGGEHQALYGYASEHYPHWESFLGRALPCGTMGENLTTRGLLETEVLIGDTFRFGSALLQVTAPRLPCFKFAHKVGRPDILKPFLQSGFCGFYFRVLEEGALRAGDAIEIVDRPTHGITMRAMLGLQRFGEGGPADLQRALAIENLNPLVQRDLSGRYAKETAGR